MIFHFLYHQSSIKPINYNQLFMTRKLEFEEDLKVKKIMSAKNKPKELKKGFQVIGAQGIGPLKKTGNITGSYRFTAITS